MSPSDPLQSLIRADLPPEAFSDGMLKLLKRQAAECVVYGRFLGAAGVRANEAGDWRDFPALPVSAFKRETVACFDVSKAAVCFETSGTTSEAKGLHSMETTEGYERALEEGIRMLMPELSGHRWVSLIPSRQERPRSSLAFMVGHLGELIPQKQPLYCCDGEFRLDFEKLRQALHEKDQPLTLLGTSSAWLDVLEHPDPLPPLPEGSLIFDTGGFKKRQNTPSQPALWQRLAEAFHIPLSSIWNEYGMTELCSQCYARADEGIHRAPPWLAVEIIDPETGKRCDPGERGMLHFYDLANVGSVAAVATLDTGYYEGDGFRLLGRLPKAPPRGCSLPYEQP